MTTTSYHADVTKLQKVFSWCYLRVLWCACLVSTELCSNPPTSTPEVSTGWKYVAKWVQFLQSQFCICICICIWYIKYVAKLVFTSWILFFCIFVFVFETLKKVGQLCGFILAYFFVFVRDSKWKSSQARIHLAFLYFVLRIKMRIKAMYLVFCI